MTHTKHGQSAGYCFLNLEPHILILGFVKTCCFPSVSSLCFDIQSNKEDDLLGNFFFIKTK